MRSGIMTYRVAVGCYLMNFNSGATHYLSLLVPWGSELAFDVQLSRIGSDNPDNPHTTPAPILPTAIADNIAQRPPVSADF